MYSDIFHKYSRPIATPIKDLRPARETYEIKNGCFRCHSGNHKRENGETISKDCNLCHTIVAQGKINDLSSVKMYESLELKHPIDIGTDWKEYACSECHRDL